MKEALFALAREIARAKESEEEDTGEPNAAWRP
jgi:hypothetical protein